MSKRWKLVVCATVILCINTLGTLSAATSYDRFAVEGWNIVGVWQQNYGIDVQNVIETKGGDYRLRHVTSKNPKATKGASKLKRSGDKYTLVDSRFGDYFVVSATGLKAYDNEGYIETLKPARP